MPTRKRTAACDRHRILAVALAAVGCAVALTACGSSGKSNHESDSQGDVAGINFADCMRSHGVPNFPDPSAGGGIQISSGSGINPQSPAFQAAQNACAKLMPGSGPGGRSASESRKLALLRLAECMRRHGLSMFPDPTSTAPAPGTGFGIAFGAPGAFIAVPQSLIQSPAFSQAAAACHFPGAGTRSGAKPAPAP
ncbi:MAG: hypothetical protein ACLP50_13945 [Solirubrobacteraceae bacterium]